MPYAFVQDVPANAEMYAMIKAKLGNEPPAGLIAHVAAKHDGGLRYVDVWESEEAWAKFRDENVEPAVGEVLAHFGIPHDHGSVHVESLDLIDVWLGGATAST